MTPLSAHFRGLCAVETPVGVAADGLERWLRRYGDVRRARCTGFHEGLRHLLPLASFPSRYLLVPFSSWTAVLNNGRNTAADEQLLPLTKTVGCRGTYGSWSEEGCVWQVVDRGQEQRSVVCYLDGDTWVFHEKGDPLGFEILDLYTGHRKRDRLTRDAVQKYLATLVDVSFPLDWRTLMSGETVCLERSTEEVRVPIEEYSVRVDL